MTKLSITGDNCHVRKMEDIEEEVIRFALEVYGWQMSEVARRLDIGRSTLYRKIKDYGITIPERHMISKD